MAWDWNDSDKAERRRPFISSTEFWFGVFVTLSVLTLGMGAIGWLLG